MSSGIVFSNNLTMYSVGVGKVGNPISEVPQEAQKVLWGKTFCGEESYSGKYRNAVIRNIQKPLCFVPMSSFISVAMGNVQEEEILKARKAVNLCECMVIARR